MADFLITISNSMRAFGPAPSTKWGVNSPYTMTWGSSKWGEGTEDLPIAITKGLAAESLSLSGATLFFSAIKSLQESLAFTTETTNEGLKTGNGYAYVFTGPTTEGEDRNLSTYASQSVGTTTYTSAPVASTSWSP